MQLLDRVMALGAAIRYAALARGANIVTHLRLDLSDGDPSASSSETDRYEELLVNPALLLLTRRRGEIDCGGLNHIIIGYGNFHQLVLPLDDGHLSVAIDLAADPTSFIAPIRRLIEISGHASASAESGNRRFG